MVVKSYFSHETLFCHQCYFAQKLSLAPVIGMLKNVISAHKHFKYNYQQNLYRSLIFDIDMAQLCTDLRLETADEDFDLDILPPDVVQLGESHGIQGSGCWPRPTEGGVMDEIAKLEEEFCQDFDRVSIIHVVTAALSLILHSTCAKNHK